MNKPRKSAIRKSARGEQCTLQLFPHCNDNPETTVLCHIGTGAGMGQKSSNLMAVYGCSDCHDVIDGRIRTSISDLELLKCKLRALERTHNIMLARGIIVVK